MSQITSQESLSAGPQTFSLDMDRSAVRAASLGLDPVSQIKFWSTFESTRAIVFPSIATEDISDDVAAVLSGSKPADILAPWEFEDPKVRKVLENRNYLDELSILEVAGLNSDVTGGSIYIIGKADSVTAIARLYEAAPRNNTLSPPNAGFHRSLGKILGYSEEAIEDFVKINSDFRKEYHDRINSLGHIMGYPPTNE